MQKESAEEALRKENQALRERLEEAEQIVSALHYNEVDALVVSGPLGDQVYTIETAERPYRLLVENAIDYAIVTLDQNGCFNSWNMGAERVLGYTEPEILGQSSAIIFTPEDRALLAPENEMRTALTEGRAEDERWHVRKDGSLFYASGVMTPFINAHGMFIGYVKIMRDLTERKQAEEERVRRERETTLLAERNRMAQELHDTLAQGFTSIKMQLEVAEDALREVPPGIEGGLKHLMRALEITQMSQLEARNSIRALRSPILENTTLAQALEYLSQADGDVRVDFKVEGVPYALPGLVENHLYRIGQEALTNARRHSQARRIALSLHYLEDQVRLTISDNGCGFDPQMEREGFGITGMQERADWLGAELKIISQIGQGTQITLVFKSSEHDAH